MARYVLAVLLAAGLALGQEDKPVTKAKQPELPAEKADDTAEVKLARKILETEVKRIELIENRIVAGSFHGGSAYVQLTDGLQQMTDAADELFPQVKDRLPWYEYRLALAKRSLDFNTPRIKQGVEEPQLGPQLEGACYKAELALLKLREKFAAQKNGDATSSPAPTPPPVYVVVESRPVVVQTWPEPAPPRLFARWRR